MATEDAILAIIEPELHPHEVAARAAWLARATGRSVDLLLCDPDVGPLSDGWHLSNAAKAIDEQISAIQTEIVEELAETIRDTDVSVTTGILKHWPIADGIIREVDERQPAMVVKGTAFHTSADRSIIAHTDWQLIRACPCPLYLAKAESPDEPISIVAAVDPTHSHDKPAILDSLIIQTAKDLAAELNGDVHLLHTYHRLVGVGSKATRTFRPIRLPLEDLSRKIGEEHREKLDEVAGAHGVDAENVHQLPGSMKEIAPMFVRTHSTDIVVMGAIARWGIKRAVIGSTVERLLDHLPCDVLIVRTSDTAT